MNRRTFAPLRRTAGCRGPGRQRSRGLATIEMALVLPILLTLMLGIVDFGRALQFNNVLVHLSREGANLAARTSRSDTPRAYIIDTLTATAEPLRMRTEGMMYLTLVEGRADGRGEVREQYRAAQGLQSIASRFWTCPAWRGDHSCAVGGAALVTLPMALRAGERVWVAETAYDYRMLSGFLFNAGPDLYAITIL